MNEKWGQNWRQIYFSIRFWVPTLWFDLKESHLDHYISLRLGTADQDAARVRHVQGLCDIFHLTLDQLGRARMADPRSAAEGRA